MRRVFLFMMVSLDGFFEGLNHDLSWTFDMMAGLWPTTRASVVDPVTAKFMNETPKIVASRAPFNPEWGNTTVIREYS